MNIMAFLAFFYFFGLLHLSFTWFFLWYLQFHKEPIVGNFTRLDGKLVQSLKSELNTMIEAALNTYFEYLHWRPVTLLKTRLRHSCSPVNFLKFLRAPFLQNFRESTSERRIPLTWITISEADLRLLQHPRWSALL